MTREPLDKSLTQVRRGMHLHVRTYTPLPHDGASAAARSSPITTLTGISIFVYKKADKEASYMPWRYAFYILTINDT